MHVEIQAWRNQEGSTDSEDVLEQLGQLPSRNAQEQSHTYISPNQFHTPPSGVPSSIHFILSYICSFELSFTCLIVSLVYLIFRFDRS